ncbi:MAG: phage/plasmid primase, P4 family [Candidatus Hodarchaeota archaeon]
MNYAKLIFETALEDHKKKTEKEEKNCECLFCQEVFYEDVLIKAAKQNEIYFCSIASESNFIDLLYYAPTEGKWLFEGKSLIKQVIGYLEREFASLKTHKVNDIIQTIARRRIIKRTELNPPQYLGVKNGVINLETFELAPHHPKYFITRTINARYDPDAYPTKFMTFLDEMLMFKEDKETVFEMTGYGFYNGYSIHNFFILYGPTHAGKSLLSNVINILFGEENYASVGLHELADDKNGYATADLYNKMINIAPDMSGKPLKDTSIIKALTGESFLRGRQIYQAPIKFKNTAKLMGETNDLPEIYNDVSNAFYERAIIIEFPNQFKGEDMNRNLLAELTTEEKLNGILRFALLGLQKLLGRGYFNSFFKNTAEKEGNYLKKSNPIKYLCEYVLDEEIEGYETIDEIYLQYTAICIDASKPPIGRRSLGKRIRKYYPDIE